MRKGVSLLLVVLIMLASLVQAQSLESIMQSMLSKNAKMYIQPLTTAFGTNMNSGFYHRARVHKILGFDISIKSMVAAIPDNAKTFNFLLTENKMDVEIPNVGTYQLSFADIYGDTEVETASVFGGKGTVLSPDIESAVTAIRNQVDPNLWNSTVESEVRTTLQNTLTDFKLPDGFDQDYIPLLMPQVSLGLPFGLEASLRYAPTIDLNDYGKFDMLGLGARLNLDQFIPIPLFPVDITAGAFYQKMTLGDLLEANNMAYHLEAGKTLSLLVFSISAYAGVQFENTDVSIDYTIPAGEVPGIDTNTQVSFETTGKNKTRINAGISLTIIPLTYINVDVSMGEFTNATVGIGINLR